MGKDMPQMGGNWVLPQPITMATYEQPTWKDAELRQHQQYGTQNWTQSNPDSRWDTWYPKKQKERNSEYGQIIG